MSDDLPPISHHAFEADGVRLHYRRIGDGPDLVVCLHGFPQTGRLWERTGRSLAQRYTVVAPDLRGAGESRRPPTGYDKRTMAGDVHALVASLGLGAVRLVGHDIGAAVAYAYATQWPDEVSHLALIEMLLPGQGLEAMFAIRHPGEFAHMPFFMAADVPEWLIAGREAAFLDWFIRNMTVNQDAFDPDDIAAYVQAYARPGALRAAFDTYRAFWQDAKDNRAFGRTKLRMPVLAVGAEMSLGQLLEQSLVPLAEDIRGHVYEGCGHFVPDEQPERLARDLLGFFDERRADGAPASDAGI
jgi:pimeloyl-ACP methyl ester carboxylesterase